MAKKKIIRTSSSDAKQADINDNQVKPVQPVAPIVQKKDSFRAKLAFYISLGSWIPLFNIGFSFAAIILSIKALRFIDSDPDKFSGRAYAIIALIIGITAFIGSILFLLVYLYKKLSCDAIISLPMF
jgi:hypothetical protein